MFINFHTKLSYPSQPNTTVGQTENIRNEFFLYH